MTVPYDELFISTKREITICEKKIAGLRKDLGEMEKRYGMSTEEFIGRFTGGDMEDRRDFRDWREKYEGLAKWGKRLHDLREILRNPPDL